MRPAISDPPGKAPSPVPLPKTIAAGVPDPLTGHEPRNFAVMALYQVAMRTGWIFKTESIIMPAVLDSIGGAGWLRGCLPMLNRFGLSVPPLLMARRIKVTRRKKWALAGCSLLMAVAFLTLSAIWSVTGGGASRWLPLTFLTIYAAFFMCTGVNQLAFGTLQGKLIRTTYRGRLMLAANGLGATSAITCALLFLPLWLRPEGSNFGMVFGFAGASFAIGAIIALLLAEPADNYRQPPSRALHLLSTAWWTVRGDPRFRRLALIAMLFGCSIMLFPHYQALGRGNRPGFDQLVSWVILQNAGTALFSLPAGPLADRYGNRLVLRLALLGICAAPLSALLLVGIRLTGNAVYSLVFVLVGLTPVTIKTLNNFTLEFCSPADHPRYLSTLSLCMAAPVFLSPLVGWLTDLVGFEAVFIAVAGLVFGGWLLTFGLHEPRHYITDQPGTTPVAGE